MTPPTTMDVPGQNCGGGESSAHLATAWCTPPRNPAGVRERRNDRNGVRVGSTWRLSRMLAAFLKLRARSPPLAQFCQLTRSARNIRPCALSCIVTIGQPSSRAL
eukprot:CAMPEP_0185313334 /NCGR_PEP_ID=MMETSP1363-20130426/35401_1 /TAXON_ID=38817 /ORGANISM="Gephyrocapsa oceanica, Strain RCC1303" /LENGTH=104 /DNA_ID=CAMNT_0027911239 /DNA_START=12 /DNA_END=326 /DNA_ORIENTATION=+